MVTRTYDLSACGISKEFNINAGTNATDCTTEVTGFICRQDISVSCMTPRHSLDLVQPLHNRYPGPFSRG
jgi:hypothetical protein